MKNLIIRTITGAAFVLLIVLSFAGTTLFTEQDTAIGSGLPFVLLFSIITAMTTWEFCTIMNRNLNIRTNRFICSVASVLLFVSMMAFVTNIMNAAVFIPYLLTIVYLLVSELYTARDTDIQDIAYAFMSQLYVALPFATLNVLTFTGDANTGQLCFAYWYPLSVFIFLWSSDTGAYCVGSLIGKRRLFPRISPKKSWEGSIGGTVVAIAASQIIAYFVPFTSLADPMLNNILWAGLAIVVVIFGTWGDLVESLIKRRLGIKDSGNILPGHGGMLDRFDSALLAIPMSVIYIYTIMLNIF